MVNTSIVGSQGAAATTVEKRVISQTYLWMSLGLSLTGFIAYYASQIPAFLSFMAENSWVFWALIIGEFGLVLGISGMIQRISGATAAGLFFVYAALNGLTLFSIFLVYSLGSIASAFFITAGMFAVMSVYGLTTRRDLSTMGNILMMGVVGIVIASVVNIFLLSGVVNLIISIVGVVVFTGLVAYDSQKIKVMAGRVNDNEAELKVSVIGALSLYLDFINLFLMLLRVFGGSRND